MYLIHRDPSNQTQLKTMIIRMFKKLRGGMEDLSENLNKEKVRIKRT